jgi:hypothetical protein
MNMKVQILKAKVQGVLDGLKNATPKQKGGRVSLHGEQEINRVIKDIGDAYPELRDDLPKQIVTMSQAQYAGESDVTFTDLEIIAQTLLKILEIVEKQG